MEGLSHDLKVESLAISNVQKQIYELAHMAAKHLRCQSYQSSLYPLSLSFLIVIQTEFNLSSRLEICFPACHPKPNDMKFVENVVESKDDVESVSNRNLSFRGSQWHFPGFNEKRLIRTIDWKILPFLFAAYFLQFMDKVILNYANVMGIQHDLGMKGDDFSWAGTTFFIAYGLAEFPQGLSNSLSHRL